jgi:Ca2+-binding EF-hand superfamily protein
MLIIKYLHIYTDPLTRLSFEMIAHSLRQDQLKELRLEFQAIDVSGKGVVNIKDFKNALKVAKNYPSYSEVDMPIAFEAMCVEWARGGGLSHFTDTLNFERGVGRSLEMMIDHNSDDSNDISGDPTNSATSKMSRNLMDVIKDSRRNYNEKKAATSKSQENDGKNKVKGHQNSQECTLTYREFIAVAMLRRIFITKERVYSAFKHLDKDNLGYLSSAGLYDVLGDDIDRETYEKILIFSLQRIINKQGLSSFKAESNRSLTMDEFLENWVHGISYEHEHGHVLSPCESRINSPRASEQSRAEYISTVRSRANSNATDLESVGEPESVFMYT